MKRTLIGMPVFGIIVVVILGILQLLNWIPSAVEEGAFRSFRNVDEVRSHLKFSPLLVPVYYPKDVRWPPSLIAAQSRPYEAVVMKFLHGDGRSTALVITQTAATHPPLEERMRLTTVRESVSYMFKGRKALLEVGTCTVSDQCSTMDWQEGEYQIALGSILPPTDLVRLAESMVVGLPAGPPARKDRQGR